MTEREQETFQDNPEHQAGRTSSIGGLWPPDRQGSFGRVKAFDTRRIMNSTASALNFFQSFQEEVWATFSNSENGNSRVQFRAVFETKVLQEISELPGVKDCVEAIIPLDTGKFGLDKSAVVYLGLNAPGRLSTTGDMQIIMSNVQSVAAIQRRDVAEIFSKPQVNGYNIEIMRERGELEISALTELYRRFNWGRDDVVELVQNPNNTFSVARKDGEIISAGIAESAEIQIGGEPLRIVEITEAATLDGHDGQGLYTAVSATLLIYLANEGSLVDLVFGECNGLSQGVLKVAKLQGRTLATEVGERFGYPGSGILHQQVPISGAERSTDYNDLVPAFLTGSVLRQYYGR